ncbi:MAG: hypothetical protein QOH70_814 [Blastocatellia bacterium]|nr:hypothetical protein [Blastocatellia bacterium]
MTEATSPIRILSIVEATTINAVAKNVLEFHHSASELSQKDPNFPGIKGSMVTFERRPPDSRSPNEFVTAARELRMTVDVIPERRRFDLSVLPKLKQVIRQRSPAIVVTHSVKSHFLLWRSHLSQHYAWVAFHHGYTSTDRKMRVYNRLDRWSLPAADRVITVCQAFAKELTGVPLEKISVQHNSIRRQPRVSAANIDAVRKRFGIDERERVVLAVGRLSREKAHLDLIQAFKRLRETNVDISLKLVIVGDGPERARLEAAAASLAGEARVVFTGQLSDVQPFYALADVFVLPSHSEGSPNVLLEAMAANVPIVATAVGGVPEMVADNESALLVPPNEPPSLAAAISSLLNDKDLAQRLATNAANLVDTQYDPEHYVRSLVKIYREVIEELRPH